MVMLCLYLWPEAHIWAKDIWDALHTWVEANHTTIIIVGLPTGVIATLFTILNHRSAMRRVGESIQETTKAISFILQERQEQRLYRQESSQRLKLTERKADEIIASQTDISATLAGIAKRLDELDKKVSAINNRQEEDRT